VDSSIVFSRSKLATARSHGGWPFWVVRNWSDVSEWTSDTALGVLLKDLKAAHAEGLKYNVALPFNALASVLLFDSMGKAHKPDP
jgi:3-hydroxyisobutyrate dehydrogenase